VPHTYIKKDYTLIYRVCQGATGTRLRVAMVGQAVEHRLIKVALDGPPSAVRASSSSPTPSMRWASSVQPSSASSLEQVRIFLAGGVVVDDPGMLEKDDTVYFSVDGGPWHEPGVAPARMSSSTGRRRRAPGPLWAKWQRSSPRTITAQLSGGSCLIPCRQPRET